MSSNSNLRNLNLSTTWEVNYPVGAYEEDYEIVSICRIYDDDDLVMLAELNHSGENVDNPSFECTLFPVIKYYGKYYRVNQPVYSTNFGVDKAPSVIKSMGLVSKELRKLVCKYSYEGGLIITHTKDGEVDDDICTIITDVTYIKISFKNQLKEKEELSIVKAKIRTHEDGHKTLPAAYYNYTTDKAEALLFGIIIEEV